MRWLKKGKRSYFGYKGFVSVDATQGFIQSPHVTPANVSEANQLSELLKPLPLLEMMLAGKGYAFKGNRVYLQEEEVKF